MQQAKKTDGLRKALFLAGVRQSDIALSAGVEECTVSNVFAGRVDSPKVIIATSQMVRKSEGWVRRQIAARRQSRRPAINPATHPEAAAAAAGHPAPELAGFTPGPIGE